MHRIINELGKQDYVTSTALEQGYDLRQGSRGARTDAGQSSEAQQSSQNAFSKPQRFHSQRIQKIVEIHLEDHGFPRSADSEGRGGFPVSVQSRWSMTDESADAAGTVH